MTLIEAREQLKMSQRQAAQRATIAGIMVAQSDISKMETGRLPIALDYGAWLGEQVLKRYRKIADMPPGILAACIKNRSEYNGDEDCTTGPAQRMGQSAPLAHELPPRPSVGELSGARV